MVLMQKSLEELNTVSSIEPWHPFASDTIFKKKRKDPSNNFEKGKDSLESLRLIFGHYQTDHLCFNLYHLERHLDI